MFFRPDILTLSPYASARDEFDSVGQQSLILLDANENSLGDPLDRHWERYPDPQQRALKQRLAELKGVPAGQIFLGNGSDEAIDLLLRATCTPGLHNAVILPPTYGMYAVQAAINGVEIRKANLKADFSPDVAAVRGQMDENTRLIFLCSPNNPTGNCLPDDFIEAILRNFDGLVVVDEAYIDFAEKPSWSARLEAFPNLVVLQTLSKAWGLAGLRLGMAFASAFIISILNKIKYPYNISQATQMEVLEALQAEKEMQARVQTILRERERLREALSELPGVLEIFPSDANFLLVRTTDADGIYQKLCAQGIIVRNRSREPHCASCLRITIGTPDENDRLLQALITDDCTIH